VVNMSVCILMSLCMTKQIFSRLLSSRKMFSSPALFSPGVLLARVVSPWSVRLLFDFLVCVARFVFARVCLSRFFRPGIFPPGLFSHFIFIPVLLALMFWPGNMFARFLSRGICVQDCFLLGSGSGLSFCFFLLARLGRP
jgi:hypothetical protein